MNERIYNLLKERCKNCDHIRRDHLVRMAVDPAVGQGFNFTDFKPKAEPMEVLFRCKACYCDGFVEYTNFEICEFIENQWESHEKRTSK